MFLAWARKVLVVVHFVYSLFPSLHALLLLVVFRSVLLLFVFYRRGTVVCVFLPSWYGRLCIYIYSSIQPSVMVRLFYIQL